MVRIHAYPAVAAPALVAWARPGEGGRAARLAGRDGAMDVRVRNRTIDYTDERVPAELKATLDHICRIDRQIERLTAARADAMRQAITAAGRLSLDRQAGAALSRWLSTRNVQGRGWICQAAGWSSQRLRSSYPPRGIPCVYLLLLGADVVYVGRSEHVKPRIERHKKDKRGLFNGAEIIECLSTEAMIDLEAVLIEQHRPSLNVRHERRPV